MGIYPALKILIGSSEGRIMMNASQKPKIICYGNPRGNPRSVIIGPAEWADSILMRVAVAMEAQRFSKPWSKKRNELLEELDRKEIPNAIDFLRSADITLIKTEDGRYEFTIPRGRPFSGNLSSFIAEVNKSLCDIPFLKSAARIAKEIRNDIEKITEETLNQSPK